MLLAGLKPIRESQPAACEVAQFRGGIRYRRFLGKDCQLFGSGPTGRDPLFERQRHVFIAQ